MHLDRDVRHVWPIAVIDVGPVILNRDAGRALSRETRHAPRQPELDRVHHAALPGTIRAAHGEIVAVERMRKTQAYGLRFSRALL